MELNSNFLWCFYIIHVLCKVVLTFESVDKVLNSNISSISCRSAEHDEVVFVNLVAIF